jgi:hypothetical protein
MGKGVIGPKSPTDCGEETQIVNDIVSALFRTTNKATTFILIAILQIY